MRTSLSKLFRICGMLTLFTCCSVFATDAFAQSRKLTGTVTDLAGQPLPGATVMVQGSSNLATATDMDGTFTLNVPQGATITVSYIGFVSKNVAVGNQSNIQIQLEEDAVALEDVVVIGYGVQKKSDVTGAISQVKSEDMENRSITDAAQALQGKTSGVHIIQTSGAPGSASTIRVRGFSSNSASDPLMIVDGLKVESIDYLDPNLIESIEVLKDAASAAIYGAQAGNGVILISTKSGSGAKNGKVFFNAQYAMTSLAKVPEVMNASQYLGYMTEAGLLSPSTLALYDGHTDTNWSDVTFEPSATQRYTVGFQGGNERGNFYTSLNWLDNDGIVRGKSDIFNRLTAQINADYKIKPWLKVGVNTSIERREVKTVSENSEYGSMMTAVLNLDPLTPNLYDPNNLPDIYLANIAAGKKYLTNENGQYYGISMIAESEQTHPFIQRDNHDNTSKGVNVQGTLYADFTPFKNFVFTSRFGYRLGYNNSSNYSFPYYASSQNKSDVYSLSATSRNNLYYQWENFANYTLNFGKHTIGAMAGMSFIESSSNYVTGTGDVLRSYEPNFRYLNYLTSDCTDSTTGVESLSRNMSYMGRLSWSYANRYMLQANFRADAYDASKLSQQQRWGYFPSVSVGWTVSNESFMKGIDRNILSFLKIRASWGQNGNVSVLNGYPYTATISVGGTNAFYTNTETLTYGSAPSGLANPNLRWETSTQYDFGIDARFLRDRLTLTVDYYDKQTDGLLVNTTPVLETGLSRVTMNAGKVKNTGLEIDLGWRDNIGDFSYSVRGNISTLNNKVTYLDPSISRISGTNFFDYIWTYFEVGYPVWYFRGYQFTGVDDATGQPTFEDYNGDGLINSSDAVFDLGSAVPDFTYGLTINLAYKNFDFTMFGTGSQGNEIVSCLHRIDRPLNNNLSLYYEDRWTPSNTSAEHPVPGSNFEEPYWHSSAQVYDASYFKIKQMQLGYTLPENLMKKIKVGSLRVYVSMDDFIILTKYPGFDPEASSGSTSAMGMDKGSFPPTKKLVFGVNLAF